MKRTLLIIGIVLLSAAVICFGISIFFHWAHGSVLDGSADLYTRLLKRFHFFMYLGIGLSVSGAAMLLISLIMKAK